MDTFLARDSYGDQLHFSVFHDDRALTSQVGVSFLGPRGALKGIMALTLEQATALAEFLDNHINGRRAPISGSCCDWVDGQLTVTDRPAGTQVTA